MSYRRPCRSSAFRLVSPRLVFAGLASAGLLALSPLLPHLVGPVRHGEARAQETTPPTQRTSEPRVQPRASKTRVPVPVDKIRVDDGDTVDIHWSETDSETVRILGIDTPETQHLPHNLPYEQPFGEVARGFARGVFSLADTVELLRAETIDPYGRTLGYLFVNGKNYSVLVVKAGLAAESVSFYGDNGLPEPSQAVLEASREAPPLAFEPPHQYRKRMRELTDWMKAHGEYPTIEDN